jgi:hypothetical protein
MESVGHLLMEKRYNMLGRRPYSAPGVTSGPSTDKSQQLLQLLQTQRISSPLFATAGTNNTFPTTIHICYVRIFFVYYTDKRHDTNGVTASTTSVFGESYRRKDNGSSFISSLNLHICYEFVSIRYRPSRHHTSSNVT